MPKKPLAYRDDEPFVFVSYAHADKQLVEPIIAGLHARGMRIWYDEDLDGGDDWERVILNRVKRCTAMLCLVSTRFTDSKNCRNEIGYASDLNKVTLILHLETGELPEHIQLHYRGIHVLRLFEYSDLNALLDKIMATEKLRCCIGQAQKCAEEPKENAEELLRKGEACYQVQSYEEAVSWYRRAAALSHPAAMRNLGVCCANGHGVPLSHEEAVRWYLRAADLGDAHAMCWLGLCYANGWGVSLSHEEAVRWYLRAADKGDAQAMFCLGICHEGGWGVSQSDEEAAKCFCRAADKGDTEAMAQFGICCFRGHGVNQSDEDAVNWFRRAADKGNGEAMRWLSLCYANGWGVPQDQEQAEYWKNKAKQVPLK